jgi:hypothetical protein
MDPRAAIMRVVNWRWTPCFAPMIGSLSFVVLCIAIVPEDIGPPPGSASGSVATRDSTTTGTDEDSEGADDTPSKKDARTTRASRGAHRATPQVTNRTSDALGSFFRAKETLPVEPVDPDPEPPPPPPPPAPTATIYTLPEPPPFATVPLPPGALPPPPGAEAQAAPGMVAPAPAPDPEEIPAVPNPNTALTR